MGVFGSSDSDMSKKLEADIEFIKTRLDLIAKQLSHETSHAQDPMLDTKLRAIYDSVRSIRIPAAPPAPSPQGPVHIEGLDELKTDVKQLLNKSDRSMHLDLAQRLDAIETRLEAQHETMNALKDAIRDLIGHLRNG